MLVGTMVGTLLAGCGNSSEAEVQTSETVEETVETVEVAEVVEEVESTPSVEEVIDEVVEEVAEEVTEEATEESETDIAVETDLPVAGIGSDKIPFEGKSDDVASGTVVEADKELKTEEVDNGDGTYLVGVTPMTAEASSNWGVLADGTVVEVTGIGAEPMEVPEELKPYLGEMYQERVKAHEEAAATRENYKNTTDSKYSDFETDFAVYNETEVCDSILNAINDARANNGLSPLTYDNNLGIAAGKVSLAPFSDDFYSVEELCAEAGIKQVGRISWVNTTSSDTSTYASKVLENHPHLTTGDYTYIGIGYRVTGVGGNKISYVYY